ncbi:helicase-related protein [Croceicoccus marinus]|uniref:Helicase n=1 Tax=Croceicoccus marinus TaxID=450378 RepID=A0A7G6VV26_9SPHN|nr:helicase-related protein [Croceicoccus marinus]QNE05591.1 helicase [Croceicoccus marinus]
MSSPSIKAVLGPTNTGKTHLAVERLCAHSSGAIGFPLRLLAREVYDRVVAIKGARHVALITGEERIDPPGARWKLCTMEAMDRDADLAFIAIDEAQLGADRERGHVFTDRLLNARGREETMILGSSSLTPMVQALEPEAEIVTRPRFSTLSHAGPVKLSRLPPRSAVVAFSAEQVYAVAEMLRRFRGGAAVVMGALSPQTRNAQVEMFQSGEVDYIVATDAIGMGLNLDVNHVAFASLTKFDGERRRRLTIAEMAQIAGRAGRHQTDGTFGTLAGDGDAEFRDDEIFAIENHSFPALQRLYWRDARPRLTSLDTLIEDLEMPPDHPALAAAPEAIDLTVARMLASEPRIAEAARGKAMVGRFWDACSLPDFRQLGAEHHARFVARLWQELSSGSGHIAHDFAAARIAELDRTGGDIGTLQGRIAAIRSWSYIAQRPDWLLQREEMAERARGVERKLSEALHARLTERFVNRRTAVLMRKLGADAGLLPVTLGEGDAVLVDGEEIGRLEGFAFQVDPQARLEMRRLLLAAAEKHLPALLDKRAGELLADAAESRNLAWNGAKLAWNGHDVAQLRPGRDMLGPVIVLAPGLSLLNPARRAGIEAALGDWLAKELRLLDPLRKVAEAAKDLASGPELRALLIRLAEQGGIADRDASGLGDLSPEQRQMMRRLGVKIGALDVFMPAMLRARPLDHWAALARLSGQPVAPVEPAMAAAMPASRGPVPLGYRRAGDRFVRIDLAERLLHAAHQRRSRWAETGRKRHRNPPRFALDPTMALSMGLTTGAYAHLLRQAGFTADAPASWPEGKFGPPTPPRWRWRPRRADPAQRPASGAKPGTKSGPRTGKGDRGGGPARPAPRPVPGNPFGDLAELLS